MAEICAMDATDSRQLLSLTNVFHDVSDLSARLRESETYFRAANMACQLT